MIAESRLVSAVSEVSAKEVALSSAQAEIERRSDVTTVDVPVETVGYVLGNMSGCGFSMCCNRGAHQARACSG